MKTQQYADEADRRRFFRIDDEVNLHYQIVDEETALNANQVSSQYLNNCSLVTSLDILDQEARLIMHRVEKEQPEIAEYLKILDSKINLISQEVLRQGNDISEHNVCNANISATGLAFESNEQLQKGELLQIKLLLTSCSAVIVIYGQVVYCKDTVNHENSLPYLIGLDYVNINEQDREILIKHVVKRQMQQIRELRNKDSIASDIA